jgi:hypothetical protein
MGKKPLSDLDPYLARQHERDDCVHYLECLNEAAHGGGRRRGGLEAVPCQDCPRYESGRSEAHRSPWAKRGDYDPTLG